LEQERLISLNEAAALCGLSMKHLGLLARKGLLKAQKIGRNWVTTESAVTEYMRDIDKRSRNPYKNTNS